MQYTLKFQRYTLVFPKTVVSHHVIGSDRSSFSTMIRIGFSLTSPFFFVKNLDHIQLTYLSRELFSVVQTIFLVGQTLPENPSVDPSLSLVRQEGERLENSDNLGLTFGLSFLWVYPVKGFCISSYILPLARMGYHQSSQFRITGQSLESPR